MTIWVSCMLGQQKRLVSENIYRTGRDASEGRRWREFSSASAEEKQTSAKHYTKGRKARSAVLASKWG